jgi:nucleoside-diphosphate-sugar epimerase
MARAPRRPLAAVTGATGFLGRHLVRALHDAGFAVRVLASRDPVSPLWEDFAPELVIGRLTDTAALERLAHGADVVVHAAGLIKARTTAEFFEVNAEGARRLAQAVGRRTPGAHLLLISSLAAREPGLSDYAASKAAGEAAARDAFADGQFTVVRPPAVYGPGDRETLGLFKAAASLPFLPLPGSDQARLALIHVSDAAAQIAALAASPTAAGVFALPGAKPEGYGWREVMATAARAVGRELPTASLPAFAVHGAGALGAALARFRGEAAIFTPGKARELLHLDWSVAPHEAAPGAQDCIFDLERGFADAASWYRSCRWL